jgi:hypothetical protein
MQKKLSELPLIPVVSGNDCCEVSRYLGGSSYTSSKATMIQVCDFMMAHHGVQKGSINGADFTGNPKTFTVTFVIPYSDTSYSVTITGEDSRSWTISNKTINGFVVSSNSNIPLVGYVYWRSEKV